MQVSEIKQQLHEAIEAIKDESYLQALLTILAEKKETFDVSSLSGEQVELLREREENYKSGQSKAVSLDKFKSSMNHKYGL